MELRQMFNLKIGDKIVLVRESYQNYDHSLVPCEPKVYTISWKGGSSMSFDERVQMPFYHTNDKMIYGGNANGVDNSYICSSFETYNDYIKGNYNKDIMFDTSKYKSLDEFLEMKRINDHSNAKYKSEEKYKELELKWKKEL